MSAPTKNNKTCENGHAFFKSSSCPVCPICENLRKPTKGLLSMVGAPARRALESKNVFELYDLSKFQESEFLSWHGIGKSTVAKLKLKMKENGITFLPEKDIKSSN